MEYILALKIIAPILGVIAIAVFNKYVRSPSEARNTKIAQMELLHKLLLEKESRCEDFENSNARDHLLQETYASLNGLNLRLDTIELLQKEKDPSNAIWIYNKYKLALKHDDNDEYISVTSKRVNIVALYLLLGAAFFIAVGITTIYGVEYFFASKGLNLLGWFNLIIYGVIGIISLVIGVFLGFKSIDYFGSTTLIKRSLSTVIKE